MIKSANTLNTSLSYLNEEQHNILDTFQGDLETVLVNAHVDYGHVTHIIVNSRAMRIGRDTLHFYMNLLNHLAAVNNTQGWNAC